jgi:hypothetical protein
MNKFKNKNKINIKTYGFWVLLFSVLILLRRPNALLHPQFWAEDGCVWYKDAYSLGIHCLFMPLNGYLQTIYRIVGIFSLIFPMSAAPFVFALISFLAQVSPIAVFLSTRFDNLVPNIKLRLFICLCYVLIPNSSEINVNLAGAHWHLAILSFLLIVSHEPKQLFIKVIDYTALVISALSGPFSIFLSPIALFELYKERTMEKTVKALVICGTAVIQLLFIWESGGATRSQSPLGASVESFIQIMGNQIFTGGILGNVETMGKLATLVHGLNYIYVPMAMSLIVIAFLQGPVIYREFMFLGL